MTAMIREMTSADAQLVMEAALLFDRRPSDTWTRAFLADEGHHLLIAYVDGEPAGFVSGVVVRHPDKRPEMLLYELGVDEAFRRRGIGTALVSGLRDLARRLGYRSMWVVIDAGDDTAAATYHSAGATTTELAEILSWELT